MNHQPERSWRGIAIPVVAGLAVAFGVSLVGTASASVNPASTVYTSEEAGFQASSLPGDTTPWHYRYVQASTVLPDVTGSTDKAAFPGGFGASVRLTDSAETAILGISTTPASGSYNAAFALEGSDGKAVSCANGNSPTWPAGATVTLTLYYNITSGAIQYNATAPGQATSVFSGGCAAPGHKWTSVQIGDEFATDAYGKPSGFTAEPGHNHLNLFTSTVVTNFTGERGSAGSAPWPVQKLAMTSDGTATGTLEASTPWAWGKYAASPDSVIRDGRNFSVWLPSYPS